MRDTTAAASLLECQTFGVQVFETEATRSSIPSPSFSTAHQFVAYRQTTGASRRIGSPRAPSVQRRAPEDLILKRSPYIIRHRARTLRIIAMSVALALPLTALLPAAARAGADGVDVS